MSNKPIEIGCKVMIIAGVDSGKIGVVLDKILAGESYDGYKTALRLAWYVHSLGAPFHRKIDQSQQHAFYDNQLIRLPDDEGIIEYDKEQKLETT